MSFRFPIPQNITITVPLYATQNVMVRYVQHLLVDCSLNMILKSDNGYFQYHWSYDRRHVCHPLGLHSLILVSVGLTTSASASAMTVESQKINLGAIFGGVIGVVAFIRIVAGLIAFTVKCRSKQYSAVPYRDSVVPTTTSGQIYVNQAWHH